MNFLNNMLSFIFPEACGICAKIGEGYLCKQCKNKLEKSKIFLNRIEDYSNDKTKYFNEHAYIFEYNSIIREKIIQYKFDNKAYLGKMFSEIFIKNEKMCGFLKKYDIIIPIPMTNKKLKIRGYNQASIIVDIICEKIHNLSLNKDILVKYKNNEVQSKLNKIQRLQNIKNVYKLQKGEMIKAKNVLLFDDIYTTGATCNECAKILTQAQPNKIGVITIAKDYGIIQTNKNRKEEANG